VGLVTLFLCAILQVAQLAPRLEEVSSDTLVVLDLDDTLICYPFDLGSTPWFEEAYQCWHPDEFHEMAGLLARKLPVAPVELELPHVLNNLKAPVLVLTGRETTHPAVPNWRERTEEQLFEAGYRLGPVHMGGRAGKAALFAQLVRDHQPTRVLIVDDRLSDLEALSDEADRLGVECEAWWYRARERVSYDPKIAMSQWVAISAQRSSEEHFDALAE
jgi:Protein of unknown function (DUF2608)